MSAQLTVVYFCAHAILACTEFALTYTGTIVDFAREARTGVYLSLMLLGATCIVEGFGVFSSARARRLTVWMLYMYFTAPVVLIWVNTCDRVNERGTSESDRSHRTVEVVIFLTLLVIPSLARLLVLTWAGYSDFLKLNIKPPERGYNAAHTASMRAGTLLS